MEQPPNTWWETFILRWQLRRFLVPTSRPRAKDLTGPAAPGYGGAPQEDLPRGGEGGGES